MSYKPWILSAMEENGFMTTSEGLVSRVADHLSNSPNDVINTDEFRDACISCNVDPDSFSERDLERLQEKLNRL